MCLACIQKGKSIDLVDIPGDERVRDRLFSKYKKSLRYELQYTVVVHLSAVNKSIGMVQKG